MMQRFAQLVSGEIRGMHNAAYVLAAFAILSSLLGFFRDRLLAHLFGAGSVLDLYYAAFRIPDLIFVLVASLVSAYVLIPEFMSREEGERHRYIESIFLWFGALMMAIGILAFAAAPAILRFAFPALMAGAESETLILMTRIMLLQPALLGFSNIVATITQAKARYVIFALSPILYNAGIIVGVIALYPTLGLAGLAWGVVLGALLHLLVPLPTVAKDGFLRLRLGGPASFLRTVLISLPRTLALSANQIVFFALIALAGTLTVGSIAVFTLAFNLQSVPLAIIGVSYSVAAFPTLVAMHTAGKRNEFMEQITLAARHIIFWTVPLIALIIVLRAHAVRVILGSGEFDWSDTRLTAAALALFAVALTAHALMSLLARGYYAMGRSWAPFFVNVFSGALAILLALMWVREFGETAYLHFFFESLLRVEGVPGTEMLALPLAYAIGAIVATLLLALLFEFQFGGFFRAVGRVFGEALAAAGVGGFMAYSMLGFLGGISDATTLSIVLFHAFIAGVFGLAGIALTFMLLSSRELGEMRAAFVRRIAVRKSVVVSSEDEAGVGS